MRPAGWAQQYADRWEQFVYETIGKVVTDAERVDDHPPQSDWWS